MAKVLNTHFNHEVEVHYEVDPDIVFNWHFPRGTLDKRMSGLELAQFLLGHMPAILPLLGDHLKIQAEFAALLTRFATLGRSALDEVLPWVKSIVRSQEDDLIVLDLNAKTIPSGPMHFLVTRCL